MNRPLYLLFALAVVLSACDAGSPVGSDPPGATATVRYDVQPLTTATSADLVVDGRSLGTVSLPWHGERPAGAGPIALRATGTDGPLTVSVSVGDALRKRVTGRALVLSVDPDDDDVEVEGTVEAVDPGTSTLSVAGLTFLVTDATVFESDSGTPFGLADLAVGEPVDVEGFYDADGTLVASEIEREEAGDDDDGDGEVEVEGPVEAVDVSAATLTVAGFTFLTTDATVFGDDDAPLTLSDLAVGDLVDVEGFYDADGTLVASEVERSDGDDDDGN